MVIVLALAISHGVAGNGEASAMVAYTDGSEREIRILPKNESDSPAQPTRRSLSIILDAAGRSSRSTVARHVKQWIQQNVLDYFSRKFTRTLIRNMMKREFPNWYYIVLVYPPHHGFEHHITNFDVTLFREGGKNIVVALNKKSQTCKI